MSHKYELSSPLTDFLSGKTHSSKLFTDALLEIESEMIAATNGEKKKRKRRSSEKAEQDISSGDAGDEEVGEHSKTNKRGRKGTGFDTNKKRRSFNKMNLDEENGEGGGDDNERPESSGEDRETGETETFRFPPDQRTIDVVTPEALILCLYYGSGVLLIKSDEFKVINKVPRCLKKN